MAAIDLANRSFGQGVAVTPLQLASAYSDDGQRWLQLTPHVVAGVAGQDIQSRRRRRSSSASLSNQLRQLMIHVVTSVPYYRAGTTLPGYTVGGKTGTAQIWDSKTRDWVPDTYNFTFVGFVGRDSPRCDRGGAHRPRQAQGRCARAQLQLSITSYQLFRRIAQDIVSALDIPPLRKPAVPSADADAGALWRATRPRCRTCPRPRAARDQPVGEWQANVSGERALRRQAPGSAHDARSLGRRPAVAACSRQAARAMFGAAVDSRRVEPGNVFVALPGERTDGHRFLARRRRPGRDRRCS